MVKLVRIAVLTNSTSADLSDGGPDHPRWVVGVCPNCHRRAHYAYDSVASNQRLGDRIGDLEERFET